VTSVCSVVASKEREQVLAGFLDSRLRGNDGENQTPVSPLKLLTRPDYPGIRPHDIS